MQYIRECGGPPLQWSPAHPQLGVPPIFPGRTISYLPNKNFFLPPGKNFLSVRQVLTHQLHTKLNKFIMKQLPTTSALVNIYSCKSHDFLYVIKKTNTETWLPRLSKATVKDLIPSDGMYEIIYRLYKNKAGYDAIYVQTAKKIQTSQEVLLFFLFFPLFG